MGEITVKEIIKKYLEDNGFDGLAGDDCGCDINDLVCCQEDCSDCEPGYKQPCDCEEEHEFHIIVPVTDSNAPKEEK